jgi:8-amino-7-oxononanoate synthase
MQAYHFSATPGRTAMADEQEMLFFSGYAYLGMHQVSAFTQLVKEGIDRYGWIFPSSRISNTQLRLFAQAEKLLSSITGSEATVLVSSGFTAGQLATELWQNNLVNLQPSHPAVQRNNVQLPGVPPVVVALDAVDTLTASITNITALLATNTPPKICIIDDSHGIGLIGPNGQGIAAYTQTITNTQLVYSYSMSKAWQVNAGAISCSATVADAIKKLPAYAAATLPSPALLHAFVHGQDVYAMQREKLRQLIAYFHALVADIPGLLVHKELPVIILPHTFPVHELHNKGIIISSFAYPDASGTIFNRVVINALHTKDDLDYLSKVLHQFI